eukprot:584091-Rhodomonas_salina.5
MSEKSGLMQQLVHTPLAAYAHPMQTPLFPYEHPPELRYLPTHALSNHRVRYWPGLLQYQLTSVVCGVRY